MDRPPITPMNPNQYCLVCGAIGTSRCGRCQNACYCGKGHQIEHWPLHKKNCRKVDNSARATHGSIISTASPSPKAVSAADNYSAYGGWCQNNLSTDNISSVLPDSTCDSNRVDSVSNANKILGIATPSEDEIFSSLNSEILSSDNNFWEIINSCDAQNLFEFGSYSEREKAIAKISQALQTGAPTPQVSDLKSDNRLNEVVNLDLMQCATLHDICQNVVHDLEVYGICVMDKFVGEKLGNSVLAEVKQLYNRGIFKQGKLTNPNPYLDSIRKDVTTWVDGREPGCSSIGTLIRKLDVVVTTCNKLPNNGQLSKYKLHRRTKAMIACYPGDGTYYKKHIDNPNKDGRCITCIYYLNQNWDVKRNGGLLRMFPTSRESEVAQIVPIFDRMIFFWSDKRNPHEVLPSFATRFAITVWYFDADERDRALLASKEKSMTRARNQFNN